MQLRTPHAALLLAAPLLAASLILSGCMGGEEDSGGLVDTYAPKYTEPVGTVHDGDFFPLNAGDIFSIGGSTETDYRMTTRGRSNGQPISEDSSSTTIDTVEGTVETLAPRQLTVSRGTFTVHPQAVLLTRSEEGSGASEVTMSYYEKTADAIHMRGYKGGEFEPVYEPDPSVFLKLPLRVGDSWESAAPDAAQAEEGLDLEMTSRARTFVVGMEAVEVAGRSVQALRLDQVLEITGTGVQDGLSMTMTSEFIYVSYLVEGEGQVRERLSGSVSVKGSMSQSGTSANVSVTVEMKGEMIKVPLQLLPHAKPGSRGPASVAMPRREPAASPSPAVRNPVRSSPEARIAAAARKLALGVARKHRLTAAFPGR